jgi:hypothetical protein
MLNAATTRAAELPMALKPRISVPPDNSQLRHLKGASPDPLGQNRQTLERLSPPDLETKGVSVQPG